MDVLVWVYSTIELGFRILACNFKFLTLNVIVFEETKIVNLGVGGGWGIHSTFAGNLTLYSPPKCLSLYFWIFVCFFLSVQCPFWTVLVF